MPIVNVSMLTGRSRAKKVALIREITDAVERALEVPRPTIRVILTEFPDEHWGVGGESMDVVRKARAKL
jgi:4-oxalocrotonate tautomerase